MYSYHSGGYSNQNNSFNKQHYSSQSYNNSKEINLLNNEFAFGLVQFFQFHPKDPNIIAASVSDGSVMLWNINRDSNDQQPIIQQKVCEAIASSCWAEDGRALYTCDIMNRSVYSTSQSGTIHINQGAHKQPIHTIRFWQPSFYITASYDDTIKIWDTRCPPQTPIFTIQTQTQQSSMDLSKNLMAVVQCKSRGVSIFDLEVLLRGTGSLENMLYLSFFSPAQYQISCVKVCPDGKRVCFGTIDGTFFMRSFSLKEHPKDLEIYETESRTQHGCMFEKQIHRRDGGPKTTCYIVDDLVINPKKDFIVGSAGGDGRLSLYNTSSKTTMRKHEFSKTIPLKKCSINADSSLLGAALGNDYAGGFEQFHKNIQPIFQVHKINDGFFSLNRLY